MLRRGRLADEQLPFGIEYRASIIMRDVNVGYYGQPGVVPFGVNQAAPEEGFRVCKDCGIVATPDDQARPGDSPPKLPRPQEGREAQARGP